MRRHVPQVGLVAACLLVGACYSSSRSAEAPARDVHRDTSAAVTVVRNARVYTVDPKQQWAEAFGYDTKGRILAVGDEDAVLNRAGANPELIDAGGHLVLPGFQDPHVHVPEAGINEGLCFIESGHTLREYGTLARRCAEEQPDSSWVRAAGPSMAELVESNDLPIDVLDRAIPDRPALILDDLGHAVWTNTLGLRAAGIGPNDPDPQGGIYDRDPDTGRLTGLLLENAQQRLRNAAAVDDATADRGMRSALHELARNGITSISDAGGFWAQHHTEAWERADRAGALTVRASNALYLYPDLPIDQQLAEFQKRFLDDPGRLLRFNTVKIYVDGILDQGTAAMLAPYDHPPNPAHPNGFFYFPRDQLNVYVNALYAMGYRMHFHAIGDAATRAALDAVEAIDAPPADVAARRNRITHTYLIDPVDIPRFAHLGVIADFQEGPESTSTAYHEELATIIGDRAFDLIPVRKLLDVGAHVSLSSDWDADPLSPFGTVERSLTREANAVDSVRTAVRLVTLDAAYALGQDTTTGSITVDKFADYTIVDQNLLDIDPHRISDTKVLLTVLAGDETYRAGSFHG